ncbi:hypothetical protein ACFL1T_01455 [Chlamydiota bacterium]
MIKSVLLVCTGNSCRSAMAQGILQKLLFHLSEITIFSAGTNTQEGMPPTEYAIQATKEIGVDITQHKASPITVEKVKTADIVIAMTEYHRRYIIQLAGSDPKIRAKVYLLTQFSDEELLFQKDIADPIWGDIVEYRLCRDRMKKHLENFVKNFF